MTTILQPLWFITTPSTNVLAGEIVDASGVGALLDIATLDASPEATPALAVAADADILAIEIPPAGSETTIRSDEDSVDADPAPVAGLHVDAQWQAEPSSGSEPDPTVFQPNGSVSAGLSVTTWPLDPTGANQMTV